MGSRGSSMSHYYYSGKRWHYSTLLLLALGAAMLSVMVVHKLREGRVLGLLLHDRENQLLSLHLILQKERAHSKEMRAKIEELKAKAASLRSHKMRLNTRLMEAENLAAFLKAKRAELELALRQKDVGEEAASVNANQVQVGAPLTDVLLQQQQQQPQGGDHAGDMERRPQQPSDQQAAKTATAADDLSSGGNDRTGESTGQEVGNGELGRGSNSSKGGRWVRIETNTDDAEPVDGGAADAESEKQEEISSEGGKHPPEVAVQPGGDRSTEEVAGGQMKENSTVGSGEVLQAMKGEEVAAANAATDTSVDVAAPEAGKPEQKDEKETDNQVAAGNGATEVNSAEAQLNPPENQAAPAQAEAAGAQSVSSDGDERSEARSTSTESYQDTNGSDEMMANGDGGGHGGGEQRSVSDNKLQSDTSESADATETGEQSAAATREGQTENVAGGEEAESSGKEDQGEAGGEQPGEKMAGDDEANKTGDADNDTEAIDDTGDGEEEAAIMEAQQQ